MGNVFRKIVFFLLALMTPSLGLAAINAYYDSQNSLLSALGDNNYYRNPFKYLEPEYEYWYLNNPHSNGTFA